MLLPLMRVSSSQRVVARETQTLKCYRFRVTSAAAQPMLNLSYEKKNKVLQARWQIHMHMLDCLDRCFLVFEFWQMFECACVCVLYTSKAHVCMHVCMHVCVLFKHVCEH